MATRTPHAKKLIRDRKHVILDFLNEYKAERGCCRCGFSNPLALQFHHIDPSNKYDSVAKLVSNKYSLEVILKEVDKCTVICANCHMIEHQEIHIRNR